MNVSKTISFLIFIVFLVSCGGQKKLSVEDIKPEHIRLKTWNEDAVKPYILVLYNTNSFLYEIIDKDKENTLSKAIYSGSYTFKNDTVFLKFKSKKQPINIKPFLIRESTGNYLVQQFKDNAPRIFFRLPDMPRHLHSIF